MSIAKSTPKRQVHIVRWNDSQRWTKPFAAVIREVLPSGAMAIVETIYRGADVLDAAEAAYDYAFENDMPEVHTDDILSEQIECQWKIAGYEAYVRGVPRYLVINHVKRQGWDAAYEDDARPYRVMGWPVGQEAGV